MLVDLKETANPNIWKLEEKGLGPGIGTGEQGNPGAHVQVHSCCLCHCACGIGRGIHLHFAGLVVAKCFCGARATCVIELGSSCCPAQIGVRVALRCVIVCVDTE